jgi:hypothetical protein
MHTIRSITQAVVLSVLLTGGSAHGAGLDTPYTPTRAEWLESAITTRVARLTSMWRQRVAVLVVVRSAANEVNVAVTLANGEAAPSQSVRAGYATAVRSEVEAVLTQFDWAAGVRVSVQFVE